MITERIDRATPKRDGFARLANDDDVVCRRVVFSAGNLGQAPCEEQTSDEESKRSRRSSIRFWPKTENPGNKGNYDRNVKPRILENLEDRFLERVGLGIAHACCSTPECR